MKADEKVQSDPKYISNWIKVSQMSILDQSIHNGVKIELCKSCIMISECFLIKGQRDMRWDGDREHWLTSVSHLYYNQWGATTFL